MMPAVSVRLCGLDALRMFAALLIFTQHFCSVFGYDAWIDVCGFRVGRIGTSLFFALGGYFAGTSRAEPAAWFRRRLIALLPAFWIATAAGFIAAALTGYKSFTAWQVVCQLAGIGYLTHHDTLVNVTTWFMTPLLMFYAAAVLIRRTSVRITGGALVAGACFLLPLLPPDDRPVACHAVTFCLMLMAGHSATRHGARDSGGPPDSGRAAADGAASHFSVQALSALTAPLAVRAASASVVCLMLCVIHPDFRYGVLSCAVFAAANVVPLRVPGAAAFALIAYEWFLVHGLALLAVRSIGMVSWSAWVSAVLLSLPAACILRHVVIRLRRLVDHSVTRLPAERSLFSSGAQRNFGEEATVAPLSHSCVSVSDPNTGLHGCPDVPSATRSDPVSAGPVRSAAADTGCQGHSHVPQACTSGRASQTADLIP